MRAVATQFSFSQVHVISAAMVAMLLQNGKTILGTSKRSSVSQTNNEIHKIKAYWFYLSHEKIEKRKVQKRKRTD